MASQPLIIDNGILSHVISWTPSLDESWRINFAGHVNGSENAGAGYILRDQNAKFIAAGATPIANCNSLVGAELVGLMHGLTMAILHGVDYVEVEGDHSTVIGLLRRQVTNPESQIIYEHLQSCLHFIGKIRSVTIRQVDIDANQGANEVAVIGASIEEPKVWLDEPPLEISEILITDVIGRWIYELGPW